MKPTFPPRLFRSVFVLLLGLAAGFTECGASCVLAPAGLVSWWPGESSAADVAGGNWGTLLNGAAFATGSVGQCFSFDGLNDLVKIPRTASLDAGNQVTIEFWMKAGSGNAMNTYQGLLTSDFYGIEIANGYALGPLGVNFFLSTDGGASVSPSSYPDTATVNGGGAVVSAGVWHHVAGTYDGTKLQLYVDGQPWGVPNYHTGAISPMRTNSFVTIGAEDGRTVCPDCVGSRYFNGMIDEPAIYNRALSAAEILAIYNAGGAGKCAPPSPPACAPAPANLVSWWKGESNASDSAGGNHGSVAGGLTYGAGEVGQTFVFDGTSSSITIPASASLNVQNFTLEGWINPLDVSSQAPVVEYGSGSTWSGVHLWISVPMGGGPGVLFANIRSLSSGLDQNIISSAPGLIRSNQWSHVALTFNQSSGLAQLYLNGTNVAARNLGVIIPDTAQPLNIGLRPVGTEGGGGLRFPGKIDELSLYSRALTSTEIQAIYNAGSAGKCATTVTTNTCVTPPTGMVAWWKGEVNAVDLVGGNNGSLQGGATFAAGEVGQAFKFNASNSYVHVPDAPALRLTNELTIECWVKRQQLTDDYLVNKGGDWTGGALNYGLGIAGPGNGNVLHFLYAGGIRGTVSITDFNWHHCAVTARNGDADPVFYLDGAPQPIGLRTGPATMNLYPSTAPLLIGAQIAPIANYFSGAQIDELSLYRRILSASEIQSIYAAGSAGKCAPTVTTNNCLATPAGLVGWWRGENNPSDSTGGNHGILRNSPAFGGGKAGSAFNFSGANDCIEIPYSASLVPANFTVETWVKPSAQVSDPIGQDLIFGQGYGHGQLVARTGTTGVRIVWQFGTSPFNFPEVASTVEIPIGQFSHLAGSWNGTTLRLYINGVLNAQSTPGAVPVDSGCSFFIGGFYSPGENSCSYVGQFFNGAIDEVSLYNRALADAEIQSLYNAGSAGKCVPVTANCVPPASGLVGWWPGAGNANDVVGGDNATLQGGATFASGKVGQGFRFDGTNGFVQIPDSAALKPANVTCEAWVWLDPSLPAGRGSESIVFKKNTWSAWFEGYSLAKGTIDTGGGTYSDRFQFVVSRYGNQVIITSQTIAQRGVWYHVAATYDGNQSKLYVNGVLEATATAGFALDYDATPVFIGTSGTWAPYLSMFGGIIDEPSIYNRALAVSEIAAIYSADSAGKCNPSVTTNTCVMPPTGMVAWWKAEGNGLDSQGPNNGALENDLGFSSGEAGQAFRFNAANAALHVPASTPLNVGTGGGFTVEGWIKPSDVTVNDQPIAEWNTAGYWGVHFYIAPHQFNAGPGALYANVADSNFGWHQMITSAGVVTSNVFQHVALTYDKASGVGTIYCNGTAVLQQNLGSFTPLTVYDLYLGRRPPGGAETYEFTGLMDEFSVYNRSISAAEIQSIYTAGSAGKCGSTAIVSCTAAPTNLMVWLRAEGNFNDAIGTNNGAQTGGVTFTNGEAGQGLFFNGSSQLKLSASPSLNVGTGGGLTLETWIRPGHFTIYEPQFVFEWNDGAGNVGAQLLLSTDHGVYGDGFGNVLVNLFDTLGNSHGLWTATNVIVTNALQHVALTYDKASGLAVIYVNGLARASTNLGSFTPQTSYDLYLGNRVSGPFTGSYFNGQLDEPSIYNRALTPDEIVAIYTAGSAGKCAPGTTTNNCIAAPSGLAAWWRGEANANDSIGGNHGSPVGALGYASGEAGQSFSFDGSASFIPLPASPSLNIGTGSGVTIECWIQPNAFNVDVSGAPIIEWDSATTDGLQFWSGGTLFANIMDTSGNAHTFQSAAHLLDTNRFQHVALTYDKGSGQAAIYLDGNVVASANFGSLTPQTTYPVNIGRRTGQPIGLNDTYGGLLDELSLYNRALSQSEIQAIYNARSAGKCDPTAATNNCVAAPSDLAAWWPGNGNSNELIHGLNGTLGGGATYTNAIVGQGFNFDGVSGRVTVPNSPSLNFGPGEDLSIECWIKAFPNSNPSNVRSIVEKRNGAENYRGYTLFLWDGFLAFQLSDISHGINYFSFGADLRDSAFHHVAVSVQRNSSSGGHLYVDGQVIYTFDPTSIGDLSNTDVLRLGQHAAPGDPSYFPGVIDDVAIYRRALSTSEIQSIYTAGSAGKCAPAVANVCAAPPANLVAWWPAENNGHDLALSHDGMPANGLGFAAGKVGQAFSFDGADDHFDIPASPGLDVGTGNGMTFETWVKPSSIAMQAVAEWNNGSGGVGSHLWLSVDHTAAGDGVGNIYANLYDTTETTHSLLSPANVMIANEWQHLAVTYDKTSGVGTLYRNGVVVSSQNLGVFTPQTSYDLHLGYRASSSFSGNYFGGLMDEPTLYGRALTAAEIQGIYNAGSAGKCGADLLVAPVMKTQPVNQTVTAGNSVSFTALADGTAPLRYQWQFNGTNISGATNTSLALLNVQLNQAGNYSLLVSNVAGYAPSSNALLTVNPAACVLPPAGLVSWWRAESNVLDSVTGNHGTLEGGATFANGKAGHGFVFDGTNSYVQIPDSATLKPANVTIEAWVWLDPNVSTKPTTESIIFKRNSWTFLFEGYTIAKSDVDNGDGTYSSRFFSVISRNGNQVIISSTTVAQRGIWYHVAATYDGNTLTLYVNGTAEASASPGFALDYGDRPVFLGSSGEPEPYRSMLAGVIDEAAIYSRALSTNEIAAIYNASSAGKCNVPVAPTLVQQPQDTAVLAGTSATFNVAAAGSAPLAYQWFANSAALTGETNATLTLNNVVYPMTGNLYSVTITNVGGSVHSRDAVLTVLNTPPQISNPGSQIVDYIAPPLGLPFTVSDAESSADNLQIFVNSSNTNLVPKAQVVLSGTGTNRLVTPTAITNLTGSTTITLTVVDEGGLSNQVSFGFTVINDSPTVSFIGARHGPLNSQIGPIVFTVSDSETPSAQLVVAATTSNNNIVPTNQIVLGVSGTDRTLTILPGTNSLGTASVTITATDTLGASGSQTFSVTWDQFGDALAGLPALQYSAVAWGDYDNDGKLDLLVSGTTNGVPSGAITRIYHNDNGAFTNFISLPGLFKCALAWNDYDRDGRLDIAISGLNSTNQAFSRIYHNNGNGTFTDLNAGLTGCYAGSVAWGDFNSDGAADLFLCGLVTTTNGTTPVSTNIVRLYRNDGGGAFTDMNLDLRTFIDNRAAGPNNGTAAWGDFDNDGRPDLLLVGSLNGVSSVGTIYRNLGNGGFSNLTTTSFGGVISSSAALGDYDNDGRLDFAVFNTSGATSAVYHNNGNNTFTIAASFSGVSGPQIAWGDYNNDGYLDLLVGNSTGGIAKLYRNNGNGTFTDTLNTTLPPTANGALAWGDYNNDGTLDAVFIGTRSTLMRNVGNIINTPPAAPFDLLSAPTLTNGVVLTWQRPVDSQTKSNGLNYNLRVGTSPGGIDIVSPLADPVAGLRRVAALGNAGPTNRAVLINLPQGTYYWSVQAIDTAFAGSTFPGAPIAADGTFTITNALPMISDILNIAIAPGTNTPGPVLPFTIGDLETSASNLVLTVRSSNTNVVALTNIVFGGSGSNRTVRVAARTNGTSVITVTVTDAQGAFASDNFTVTAEQFSLRSSNFVQVQNSLIAWGDYNNDGRLDVLIAGNTNGNLTFPVTRLYRNDGNGVFTPVTAGLPNLSLGSAAWGDFNSDGWLDVIVTGTTNGNTQGALARVYRNNGDGTFTDINAGLPNLFNGAVAWGDYDNDGRPDLLLSGTTNGSLSGAITRIYRNNGNGTFSNAVSLAGIYLGSVAWADFDGDGDLDVVIAGQSTSGVGTALVYRNNGNGTFTQAATLTGVYNCSLAVGDFNNDGLPDILLTGYNGSYLSLLYRNAGNFSFVSTQNSLPGLRYASIAAGDFDNDGRPDILISGTTTGLATSGMTRVYRNTTTVTTAIEFNQLAATLPTNYLGAVTWADFNNDGRLDVMITGVPLTLLTSGQPSQTVLYRNNNNLTNTPPTVPTALSFVRSNNLVSLAWAKSSDTQTTNANGLKYQIRVGTNSGGLQIESPLADLSNGYRRVVQTGDASTNRWQLQNLPPGNYFWSAQAIDTAFAGSPFATEATFTISHPPVANPDAITTASNTPVSLAAAKLALNDTDPDGDPLTVIGVSVSSVAGGNVTFISGQVTYAPPAGFTGSDAFSYTISDGQSRTAVGTVTVTVGSGGGAALNLVFGPVVDGDDFVVRFAGIPGLTYTIEAAPDVSGPWAKVANLTAPTYDQGFGVGIFEFREPMNGNTTRFYRSVYPSY